MEASSGKGRLLAKHYSACDACHSRKVRCDRNNPCGNCQDQRTPCTRRRNRRRLPKRISLHAEMTSGALQPNRSTSPDARRGSIFEIRQNDKSATDNILSEMDDYNMSFRIREQRNYLYPDREQELHRWILLVPLTDAQLMRRRPLDLVQGLTRNRIQVIESAFYVASQLSQSIGGFESRLDIKGASEEQPEIPSVEFLTWMLNDLGGNRFGPFVLDYFKHVSRSTLKHMGLSLLRKTASPHDTLLYTVCVNSVAYKFISCLLMNEDDDELSKMLQERAVKYKRTAQAALRRIPLLTSTSLALLQATLCGIFLCQGSGETQLCCDLTRIACKVCVDLGLHAAANWQGVTEEEYYCTMWCYMLDRNYAWKLGKSDCLLKLEPGIDDTSVSELFSIYMELAHVQSVLIPFLKDESSSERETAGQSFSHARIRLFSKMDGIRRKIDQISPPSPRWTGLDVRCEVATLNFGYHSLMTTILHLTQVNSDQHYGAGELYLQSARQELSALVCLCLPSDQQRTAAFLHWTLLYYPLTACFVLFCNAVATSHLGDFHLLKTVANCLMQIGTVSQPIATLQRLFHEFVLLSQSFMCESGPMEPADDGVLERRSNLPRGPTPHHSPTFLYGMDSAPGDGQGMLSDVDDYFFDPSFSMLDQMLSQGELAFLNESHSDGNFATDMYG